MWSYSVTVIESDSFYMVIPPISSSLFFTAKLRVAFEGLRVEKILFDLVYTVYAVFTSDFPVFTKLFVLIVFSP